MLFQLGRVVITPAAKDVLVEAGADANEFLSRHRTGDCGSVDQEDKPENWAALIERYRFISIYHITTGAAIWVITERDRGVTTVLVPEECQAGNLNHGDKA
jgi:hypothetical protein